MLRHEHVTWSNPKVLTTLGLIFLCGVALGCVLTGGYLHARFTKANVAPSTIESARHIGLANLRTKLNLSPTQEQEITKILDDYGKFYQNIEDERQDVAQYGSRRILSALTPEQQAKFHQMLAPASR